ncbi:hypothetical protein LAJPDJIK_04040 [Aeromonas salmonicida]
MICIFSDSYEDLATFSRQDVRYITNVDEVGRSGTSSNCVKLHTITGEDEEISQLVLEVVIGSLAITLDFSLNIEVNNRNRNSVICSNVQCTKSSQSILNPTGHVASTQDTCSRLTISSSFPTDANTSFVYQVTVGIFLEGRNITSQGQVNLVTLDGLVSSNVGNREISSRNIRITDIKFQETFGNQSDSITSVSQTQLEQLTQFEQRLGSNRISSVRSVPQSSCGQSYCTLKTGGQL